MGWTSCLERSRLRCGVRAGPHDGSSVATDARPGVHHVRCASGLVCRLRSPDLRYRRFVSRASWSGRDVRRYQHLCRRDRGRRPGKPVLRRDLRPEKGVEESPRRVDHCASDVACHVIPSLLWNTTTTVQLPDRAARSDRRRRPPHADAALPANIGAAPLRTALRRVLVPVARCASHDIESSLLAIRWVR